MAEVVVSAVVTVLIEKLLAGDLMNLARSEGLEAQLKKLKKNFLLIEAVLADSAQKQNQKPVHMWLVELQDLAYDIDDVLDDMATEVLRRKLNHQASHDSTRASCSKLSQEHLQSVTSLEEMWIDECPSIEDSFPSCGLWPPNLKCLRTGELKNPLSESGLQNYPSSLVDLTLYGRDSGVVSFGVEEQHHNNTCSTCFLLPPSLTSLEIWEFEEVESISEVLQHLPHLQRLEIRDCPKLKDVPETTSSLEVTVWS